MSNETKTTTGVSGETVGANLGRTISHFTTELVTRQYQLAPGQYTPEEINNQRHAEWRAEVDEVRKYREIALGLAKTKIALLTEISKSLSLLVDKEYR